jgi:4-amino-4-deoxy-L-arabinose transferase-like glycosyltransferase
MMFVLSVLITYIFIKISDSFKGDWFKMEGFKNGDAIKSKTFLVRILILFSKKKSKTRVSAFLFLTEPLLFILYYREGHHLYNGIPDKKTWLLLLICSLNACVLWAIIIIVFNSFGILVSSSIVVIFFMTLLGIYLI